MIKYAIMVIMMICAIASNAQNLNQNPSADVLASAYGARNSSTITNIITQSGSRGINLILDGGAWSITNNVTFPTNVAVTITRNSFLSISNGITVTFQTNEMSCGHWPAFSGAGIATGTAHMIHRPIEWGSMSQFHIGEGDVNSNNFVAVTDIARWMTNAFPNLQTNATSANSALAGVLTNGNNAAMLQATNFSRIQAGTGTFDNITVASLTTTGTGIWTGTNIFAGTFLVTNDDAAVSFMGYPKVSLTTNMGIAINGNVGFGMPQFTNAYDLNMATVMPTMTSGAASTANYFLFDLTNSYTGYVRIKYAWTKTGSSGIVLASFVPFTMINTTNWADHVGNSSSYETHGQPLGQNLGTFTNSCLIPVASMRYFAVGIAGNAVGDVCELSIYDLSLYGVTNANRNMGGN